MVDTGFESIGQVGLVYLGEPSAQLFTRLLDGSSIFQAGVKELLGVQHLSGWTPKLLTGCFMMDGFTVPKIEKLNLSNTFPFFITMDPHLEGLKLISAQEMSLLSSCKIQLLRGTDVCMMERSSI